MDKMIKAKELGIPVFGVMRHLLNGYELSMDRRLDDEDLRYNVDLDALNAGFIPLLGIPRDILEKRKVIHEAMSKDSEIRVSTEKYELVPSKIRDFLFDGIERATEKARSYGDKIALARVYVSHPEFDKGVDENIESARRRLDKKRSSR